MKKNRGLESTNNSAREKPPIVISSEEKQSMDIISRHKALRKIVSERERGGGPRQSSPLYQLSSRSERERGGRASAAVVTTVLAVIVATPTSVTRSERGPERGLSWRAGRSAETKGALLLSFTFVSLGGKNKSSYIFSNPIPEESLFYPFSGT
ncbi:hypothetical protein ElyMa_002237800, partial [Elysia marginata]